MVYDVELADRIRAVVQRVEETFHEAYMAQTSTSPNYQILASLDLGRRQAVLEAYELVQKQVEYAMSLRDAIDNHPLLRKYIRCLTTADLIPRDYRPPGIDQPLRSGLAKMVTARERDEFVLDPSRITLYIGPTGIDGDTFKRRYLMDRYGLQINKTSRNSVLFMTNIGTTRSSVAYLIEVLVEIVRGLEDELADLSPRERAAHEGTVLRLTNPTAPLPDFSAFHDAFRAADGTGTPEGDRRRAFFLAYDDSLRIPVPRRTGRTYRGRPAGGVGDLRDPLPARLPRPRPRADLQPGNPDLHAQPGHAGDPWLPAAPRIPRLSGQGDGTRRHHLAAGHDIPPPGAADRRGRPAAGQSAPRAEPHTTRGARTARRHSAECSGRRPRLISSPAATDARRRRSRRPTALVHLAVRTPSRTRASHYHRKTQAIT
jgi:hypothetical protein